MGRRSKTLNGSAVRERFDYIAAEDVTILKEIAARNGLNLSELGRLIWKSTVKPFRVHILLPTEYREKLAVEAARRCMSNSEFVMSILSSSLSCENIQNTIEKARFYHISVVDSDTTVGINDITLIEKLDDVCKDGLSLRQLIAFVVSEHLKHV